MAARIGRAMAAVAFYVSAHEGTSMMSAASYAGPHGSLNYGYRAVHRAIDAGIVVARRSWVPQRKWDLYSAETGLAFVEMDRTEGPVAPASDAHEDCVVAGIEMQVLCGSRAA